MSESRQLLNLRGGERVRLRADVASNFAGREGTVLAPVREGQRWVTVAFSARTYLDCQPHELELLTGEVVSATVLRFV